jgi:hypothetical protein
MLCRRYLAMTLLFGLLVTAPAFAATKDGTVTSVGKDSFAIKPARPAARDGPTVTFQASDDLLKGRVRSPEPLYKGKFKDLKMGLYVSVEYYRDVKTGKLIATGYYVMKQEKKPAR